MDYPEINVLTGKIVDTSLRIHKKMGPGLFEKVYEDCLEYEFKKLDLNFKRQHFLNIEYDDLLIKNAYKVDFLVEDSVILELKSTENILAIHEAQIMNYMRLSGTKIGLLINFNVKLIKNGIKRFAL